jgi:hypothetical protein
MEWYTASRRWTYVMNATLAATALALRTTSAGETYNGDVERPVFSSERRLLCELRQWRPPSSLPSVSRIQDVLGRRRPHREKVLMLIGVHSELHGKRADARLVTRPPNGSASKLRGQGPRAEVARQAGCRA